MTPQLRCSVICLQILFKQNYRNSLSYFFFLGCIFVILGLDRPVGNHVRGESKTGAGLKLRSPEAQRHSMSEGLPIWQWLQHVCFIFLLHYKSCKNVTIFVIMQSQIVRFEV